MPIHAYAAAGPGQQLEPFTYEPGELAPWEVEITISHCGICYSDLHLIDNAWGSSTYPLVPGHEIIGRVNAVGSSVTHVRTGQQVGVGWQAGSCLACEWCLRGEEQLCPDQQATCMGRYGGFADAVCVDSRFVFAVPEELDPTTVAPLLCGGITVYTPLRRHSIHGAMRVGIIGIGGLGHLALQFAHALGCEITAFSTSPDKEEEARRLGAEHFVVSSNEAQMKQAANTLDFILSTVYANLDWRAYLRILRPNGTLCLVSGGFDEARIPLWTMIDWNKSISGSVTGSRSTMQEMLWFAARHGIRAMTETMPMTEVNTAIERVRRNEVRYRLVLVSF